MEYYNYLIDLTGYKEMFSSIVNGINQFITILIIVLVLAVMCLVAWCLLFKKAGMPREREFVPIYNEYSSYAVADCTNLFWVNIAVYIVCIVVYPLVEHQARGIVSLTFFIWWIIKHAVFCFNLAISFGKGIGWGIGLFFLYPFFLLALGVGSSKYEKKASVSSSSVSSASAE